jgi:hypothetical protein
MNFKEYILEKDGLTFAGAPKFSLAKINSDLKSVTIVKKDIEEKDLEKTAKELGYSKKIVGKPDKDGSTQIHFTNDKDESLVIMPNLYDVGEKRPY